MLGVALTDEIFAFILVFTRVGAALMLLPTFGEAGIPGRARLHFALAFSLILAPLLQTTLPPVPDGPLELFIIVLGEIVVGVFLGSSTRVVMSALHVAGMIFAFQSSLSAAQIFDPNQSAQTSITGNFLTFVAVLLIFVSDLHHLLLAGLVESYVMFPPGDGWPKADGAGAMARLFADSFRIGMQISAPVLVGGFTLYLGAGLLNRLMPQMMVFFVMLPIQITLAFSILALSLSGALYVFIRFFDETWLALTVVG
jgi:flagellar biosynthetic protein FliR